ncbi:MAG TPA: peptidoglycan-associated lipoprotein Pal [Candidatus Angelobacter sp.]|nr:peptidoglycan-associated lipoprotein Pal [Candidatus Angelobacter sp.]
MNYSKRHWSLILGMLAALLLVSGCNKGKHPQPPPPPPTPAPTANLSANPNSIQRGQSATLTWSTENATDVALDGNKVDPSGSQTVSPTETTTYHLTAKGAGGTQEATAQITVAAPTPTPTPVATPTPTVTDDQLFAQNITDVYFDYDKADLRPDGQQMLARAAQMIKQKGWRVQIEGNCDERGSTEYNLALGERRADSAKQALIQGGVSADSIKTISYGKEKPQCTESNEDCWQKNRRDHFTLLH